MKNGEKIRVGVNEYVLKIAGNQMDKVAALLNKKVGESFIVRTPITMKRVTLTEQGLLYGDRHEDAPYALLELQTLLSGRAGIVEKECACDNRKLQEGTRLFPQDSEENEYRYIEPRWLDGIARGLTAGAVKHPGETWKNIPANEHLARAMRHINLYLMGDRSENHIINASMRLMMAEAASHNERGE